MDRTPVRAPRLAATVYAQVMGDYQAGFVAMLRESNGEFFAGIRAWWRAHHTYVVQQPMQPGVTAALWFGPAQEFSRYWIAGDEPKMPGGAVESCADTALIALCPNRIEEDHR